MEREAGLEQAGERTVMLLNMCVHGTSQTREREGGKRGETSRPTDETLSLLPLALDSTKAGLVILDRTAVSRWTALIRCWTASRLGRIHLLRSSQWVSSSSATPGL